MDSEILFRCRIEVPKHISKKNQKRVAYNRNTKKPFIMQESKSKFIMEQIERKLRIERFKSKITTPIDCDINAQIILIYPKSVYFTKAGQRSSKVLDLSNACQTYEDVLESSAIILNDRIICGLNGSTRTFTDEPKYLVEIVLTKI
jgi:Holliday junction resolvase RusA-like endonuclease